MINKLSECFGCVIKKLCISHYFTNQELEVLDQYIVANHHHQRGNFLGQVVDCLKNIVVLKSGSAKTELLSENGDKQIVAFHFSGDILSMDTLGCNQIKSSVIFLEKSITCAIQIQAMDRVSAHDLGLYKEIIARLSSEIACAHESMLITNNFTAEQRLAVFLIDLANRQQKRNLPKEHLILSMPRNDIGNYLGLASETVSRIISKFERQGLIKVENRHLELTNFPALVKASHYCPECLASSG